MTRLFGRLAAAVVVAAVFVAPAAAQPSFRLPTPTRTKVPGAAAGPSAPATSELLVFVGGGHSAADLARDYGLSAVGSVAGSPNIVRFDAGSAAAALAVRSHLAADARVEQAFVQHDHSALRRVSVFNPNDPIFFPGTNPPVGGPGDTTNPNFPGQWYLENRMPTATFNDPSIHVRARGAWDRDLTGSGVTIGVVDNAIQITHADLAPNVVAGLSRNFVTGTSDSSPVAGDTDPNLGHGTATAGLAAARGANSIGITGAAALSGLAGLRVSTSTGAFSDTALADAYGWRNDVIKVKSHSYGIPAPFINDAALSAVLTSTAAVGVIHVFAAGNDRGTTGEDTGMKQLQANSNVITVTALGSNGRFADYANYGANVFVTVPSSRFDGQGFIVPTTDMTGTGGFNSAGADDYANLDYTRKFGGTSASAPIASGVIALAVQARNQAGLATDVRVIKHLLVRTSRVVDAADATAESDAGWAPNAAGVRFNQNYGFGLIDANALTIAAPQFNVTPQGTHTRSTTAVGQTIPDNSTVGVSRTFPIATSGKLEDINVTFDITHPFRGDLTAFLTSPSGTSRRLFAPTGDAGDNINWTFTTYAFWGEEVNGTWRIDVFDLFAEDVGTWNSYAVTFHTGELVPVPEPATVGLIGFAVVGGWAAWRRRAARVSREARPSVAA